jgi:peptidoglycan/xylan/chitin deacetylase (PgdA/CDA1 family)
MTGDFGKRGQRIRNQAFAWLTVCGLLCVVGQIWSFDASAAEVDSRSAVVFLYHRFGEDSFPTTSVTLEQFEAHLRVIETGPFNVAPLPEIVTAIKQNEPIPDRTIALTVDDAFLSVYTEAWPRLRKAGLPFTLFVATDAVDEARPDYMNWAQIRELAEWGVTIGSQTSSHLHMPLATQEQIISDVSQSMRRLKEELGFVPTLFAYPYGEFNRSAKAEVETAGFDAAFGQHSGVAYGGMEMFEMPRFSMNQKYGDVARFRMAANALPLPVADRTPTDAVIKNNPPPFGFSITENFSGVSALACFYSHESEPAKLIRLGPLRIEARAHNALPVGRVRVNCTAPAGNQRWRWFGTQFIVPQNIGISESD